ncbi:hypothetical protein ABEG18_12890 [Alsobacter sp. KACC 23698]|uniref:DUF4354 family protein n=1 Tax=Alsobacter sp. KACC 23698 TaxID=3149229 RepID=A0AAU7JMU2_9HYPH
MLKKILYGFVGLGIIGAVAGKNDGGAGIGASASADRGVRISQVNWRKEAFGNVMIADFMVRNDNDFAVKDLTIECQHAANSGTIMDRNTRQLYERVSARSYLPVQNFNMGFINTQAVRTDCKVTNFSRL